MKHYLNTSRINTANLIPPKPSRSKRVMRRAWLIAARAAELFGGRKVEYFREALRQAWAEEKDPTSSVLNDIRQRKAAGGEAVTQRRVGHRGKSWYAAATAW
ncbi:hypothetical protein [Hwanghaeella sp.]|uniref:hypothetical protein n=1 Tax=Hwanghaeella sp. TaxID=2605943 RepID=UPI003CCBFEA6